MAAALRNLALVDAPRRVAVLGEMAELGDGSDAAHRQMGDLAESLGIEVVAVGGAPYGGTPVADLGRGAANWWRASRPTAWC